MKHIPIGEGMVATVDDEDYWRLTNERFKWVPCKARNNWVAVSYYINDKGYPAKIYMHREVLGVTDPEVHVDHKDGKTLNNSKSNLRRATVAENARNVCARSGGSSKYKGVTWNKRQGKWEAKINHNKKRIFIGYFVNEIDAAIAYNEKAKELHGEFAWLNPIP